MSAVNRLAASSNANLSATDLSVLARLEAPAGTASAQILGPVRRGRWLCRLRGSFAEGSDLLLELGGEPLELAPRDQAWPVPEGWGTICPTTTLGHFVVQLGPRVELWDLRRHQRLAVLSTRAAGRRLLLDEDTVFLLGEKDILMLEAGTLTA